MSTKVHAYIAEFTRVEEPREEGGKPEIKYKGKVRLLVSSDYNGSLAALAFKRADRDQLDCNVVSIRKER